MTPAHSRRFMHLATLLDGYLHQDFVVEHGTAAQAVQAWLAEIDPAEALAASAEWRTFLNVTAGMSTEARARALRDVAGGAWAPATDHDFQMVSALLLGVWRG